MKGLACDFRVVGVTNTELRDYLRRTFEKVGVGYYPNSSFVHLDVRKDHSAFWIDYSGPGERAMYSSNPSDDLRTGRAEHFHPSKIDESWVDSNASQAQPQADADRRRTAGRRGPPPIRRPAAALRAAVRAAFRDAVAATLRARTNKRPFVLVSARRRKASGPSPTTHPRRIL